MKNLQPQGVWQNFAKLTQIPRPSGKKEQISQFLVNYGKSLGLETQTDAIGNVLIRKPASPGYENHPGVIRVGDRQRHDAGRRQRHRRGYGYGYSG